MCPECQVGKADFEMLDITDVVLEESVSAVVNVIEPIVIIWEWSRWVSIGYSTT